MGGSSLGRSILARLLQSLLVVLVVVTVVFFVSRVTGDPISYLAPIDATPKEIQAIKQAEGLNDPVIVQYGRFLWGAVRLDFGRSFRTRQPAMTEGRPRLGATLGRGPAAIA